MFFLQRRLFGSLIIICFAEKTCRYSDFNRLHCFSSFLPVKLKSCIKNCQTRPKEVHFRQYFVNMYCRLWTSLTYIDHIQEKRKCACTFWISALNNESHRRPEMQGAAFIWLKKNVTVRNSRKLNTVLWFYDTNFAIRPSQNRTAVPS
jgi:hypothetical protein